MTRPSRRLAALFVGLTLVVGACGTTDDEGIAREASAPEWNALELAPMIGNAGGDEAICAELDAIVGLAGWLAQPPTVAAGSDGLLDALFPLVGEGGLLADDGGILVGGLVGGAPGSAATVTVPAELESFVPILRESYDGVINIYEGRDISEIRNDPEVVPVLVAASQRFTSPEMQAALGQVLTWQERNCPAAGSDPGLPAG